MSIIYIFLIGLWNFRFMPRHPPHMDTKISCAEAASPDELDRNLTLFRIKGTRCCRIQMVVGDIATQGERFQALLSWRVPRATCFFVILCLVAALVLYVTPFKIVALVGGMFRMRQPKFRSKMPSAPSNFFRKLPSKADMML
ncbi:unnamed protein product [Brassica oleracea var. botrytis]|nr:unnamed protein product [Brassica napus]VDD34409.1 unnamed protein product [Brassica oleracea]